MDKERLTLEIPYGMRDFLPTEAAEKRAIEAELAALFAEWGYDEVVTPTIEYLDNLTLGASRALEPHLFKLFDKDNRTLALRHEMTTPIARLSAALKALLCQQCLPLRADTGRPPVRVPSGRRRAHGLSDGLCRCRGHRAGHPGPAARRPHGLHDLPRPGRVRLGHHEPVPAYR